MKIKKALTLILTITILLSSITACSEQSPPIGEFLPNIESQQEETVYVDWFGIKIDLKTLYKDISPTHSAVMPDDYTYADAIAELDESEENYTIVRAKCTANWLQKVYENKEHYSKHFPGYGDNNKHRLYTEIPFAITEVLEGDKKNLDGVTDVNLEFPALYVAAPFMGQTFDSWESDASMSMTYDAPSFHFVYPRVDYEYVICVIYNKSTKCYTGTVYCEISSPEDYHKFRANIYNRTDDSEYTVEKALSPFYYEILERYNIKVD